MNSVKSWNIHINIHIMWNSRNTWIFLSDFCLLQYILYIQRYTSNILDGKLCESTSFGKMTWYYMLEIKPTKAMLYHVRIVFNNILYCGIYKYIVHSWYKQKDNMYNILAFIWLVVDLCQKVCKVFEKSVTH